MNKDKSRTHAHISYSAARARQAYFVFLIVFTICIGIDKDLKVIVQEHNAIVLRLVRPNLSSKRRENNGLYLSVLYVGSDIEELVVPTNLRCSFKSWGWPTRSISTGN